jgi:hypothetical protein
MGPGCGVRTPSRPVTGVMPHLPGLVAACLVCGGLVAAVWLVGTRSTDWRLAVSVGGILGSASPALIFVTRPPSWWRDRQPAAAVWLLWWIALFMGPLTALALSGFLVDTAFGAAMPAAQHDRLPIGFAIAAAVWRWLYRRPFVFGASSAPTPAPHRPGEPGGV